MKEYSVILYINADDLDAETIDRIYEAGFDDATLARSGGKTKVMLDREGESWIDVALKAAKQLHDAGFVAMGMELDKGME